MGAPTSRIFSESAPTSRQLVVIRRGGLFSLRMLAKFLQRQTKKRRVIFNKYFSVKASTNCLSKVRRRLGTFCLRVFAESLEQT